MRFPRVRKPWLHWDEHTLRRNAGLYVHIPFCLARCGYCDFLTYGPQRPAELEPQAYAAALEEEIARRGAWAYEAYASRGRKFDTVFFGGGTPTYFEPEVLTRLIQAVREHFALADNTEFTVETNPDTLSAGYLAALAGAGVNRLSIGIQAAQPRHLRLLQRTHRWEDIQPNLQALQTSGIKRWSFDVIYSLPGLLQCELLQTMRNLLAFRPGHISAYELILEPGTLLSRCAQHLPRLKPRERETIRQQRLIERVLADAGLYRYEVSNYARPGAECRHNLRYWRGGDYLGLGLGAASRIGPSVLNNPRNWGEYQRVVKLAGDDEDQLHKAWAVLPRTWCDLAPPADVFLQLRTRLGISGSQGCPRNRWQSHGWIKPRTNGWEVTKRGLNFAERIALEID